MGWVDRTRCFAGVLFMNPLLELFPFYDRLGASIVKLDEAESGFSIRLTGFGKMLYMGQRCIYRSKW